MNRLFRHSSSLDRCLAAGLFVAATASSAAAQSSIIEETRINVGGFNANGNNAIDGVNVQYDTTRNRFFAVYSEQNGTGQATQDIYFVSSNDEGITWGTPVRVDLGDAPNSADSQFPKAVVTGNGNYIVAWEETRDQASGGSTNHDVFYNVSTDGGVTWRPTSLALNTPTAGTNIDSDIDRIYMAANGNNVYVTWEEDSQSGLNANEEVQFARSTNGGLSFLAPVILSSNPGPGQSDVDEPQVHASNGLVVVTYIDDLAGNDQIFLRRSVDGGANFSAPINVETDPTGNADECMTQVWNNVVLCAWTDNYGGYSDAVRCAISNDGGQTFGPEQICGPAAELSATGDADGPYLAVWGPNAYVVWASDHVSVLAGGPADSAGNETYLSYTNNGGASWTHEVALDAGVVCNRPIIDVDASNGTVHVWVEHNPNGSNVPAFTYSVDNGTTWAPFEEVPNAGPDVDEGNNWVEGEYWAVSPVSNTIIVGHFDRPLGQNEVYISGNNVATSLGTNYCSPAVANTTGQPGTISATGSILVAANQLTLRASSLPNNQFGIFITSASQGFVPGPGGSLGNLCLAGGIGRYNGPGQILNSGSDGTFMLPVNLAATPTPAGPIAIVAGQTRHFQAWYRDLVPGQGPVSNFTDATSLTFQ